ncbi:YwhD family protein [Mechercharimyces sp. CAU 1602]|uniref:YwhD family protein n=1 Tax=Mechercharimyces sp. CAU 1602 TaxID=2973933 RepID=UPI002162CB81|nr:YwhD family protein [Mechercharimyces sp. CAU 1602]MCS1352654.1 YwhD family protein [Mechercharimyces sp. CAU 1602]
MADKKKNQFNILRDDATTHGGYHTGTFNLSDLSSVLVDQDTAKIDLGLIHAKSRVERGIKFSPDEETAKDGKTYWIVWVSISRNEEGPYYAGVTACPMRINHETRQGWKNLAYHVNRMDDALKGKVKLDGLDEREKEALKKLLVTNDEAMWERSLAVQQALQ